MQQLNCIYNISKIRKYINDYIYVNAFSSLTRSTVLTTLRHFLYVRAMVLITTLLVANAMSQGQVFSKLSSGGEGAWAKMAARAAAAGLGVHQSHVVF